MGKLFRFVLWAGFVGAVVAGVLVAWFADRGGHFVSPVRLVLYGGLPLGVSLVSLTALFLGQRARIHIAVYGLALGVSLGGVELYLQGTDRSAAAPGGDGDAAMARAIKATFRANGLDVFGHYCGASYLQQGAGEVLRSRLTVADTETLPLSGLAGNHRIKVYDSRVSVRRTDEYGFNNPPGQWRDGAVMVTGDSFAFGADVPFEAGFVDRLRARFAPVVNLACGGNGPLLELAAVVEYGPLLRPPVVLWAYYEGNDLTKDIVREHAAPILARYLEEGHHQGLAARNADIQPVIWDFLDQRARAKISFAAAPGVQWRSAARLEYLRTALGLTYGFKADALDLFTQVLARAQDVVQGWGGRLVFVYLPGEGRYVSWPANQDADGYRRAVLDRVRGLGVPVIDVVPVFAGHARPGDLFRGNYTAEGHAMVAEAVSARLPTLAPELDKP